MGIILKHIFEMELGSEKHELAVVMIANILYILIPQTVILDLQPYSNTCNLAILLQVHW